MIWTLIQVGIIIGAYVVSRYMAPDAPPRQSDKVPQLPTVEEGAPLPLVYGRDRIRTPVLVWWGNFASNFVDWTSPPVIRYGMDMLFSLGIAPPCVRTIGGWKNHVILNVYVNDRPFGIHQLFGVAATELSTANKPTGRIMSVLDNSAALGGPGSGGGVSFGIEFWDGHEDPGFLYQDVVYDSAGALTQAGLAMQRAGVDLAHVPGYAHQLMVGIYGAPWEFQTGQASGGSAIPVFYNQWTGRASVDENGSSSLSTWSDSALGESSSPPTLNFEVICKGTGQTLLTGDANPVDVIQDLLTGSWGRLGFESSVIDAASFEAARVTLAAEQHGYSRQMAEPRRAKEWIGEIIQQIGAVLWVDQTVGKFKIKLLRADYTLGAVPQYGDQNVVAIEDYATGSWRETINQVRITYPDRFNNYNQGSMTARNPANAVGQDRSGQGGRVRQKTIDYPGVREQSVAAYVAKRDLAVLSRPFAKLRMVATREAATLSPGDVIALTWDDFGLAQLPYRVLDVDVGQLHDNRVSVSLIVDAFADQMSGDGGHFDTFYLPVPAPLTRKLVTEAPYWLQARAESQGIINNAEIQRSLVVATPDDGATSYRVDASVAGAVWGNVDLPETRFGLAGKVAVGYAKELEPYDTTTGLVVEALSGALDASLTWTAFDVQTYGQSLLVTARGEIMAYESVTDLGGGQYRLNNVWRALLDTAPHDHSVGDDVFWLNNPNDATDFLVDVKYVGRRGFSTSLALGMDEYVKPHQSITWDSGYDLPVSLSHRGRAALTPRPADFLVNGEIIAGTQGLPTRAAPASTLGYFKHVTNLEEGFGFYAAARQHRTTVIVRGDATSEALETGASFYLYARKVGGAAQAIATGLAAPNTDLRYLLGSIGYGDLELLADAPRTVTTFGGLGPIVTTYPCWDLPVIGVRAERWRNLLANPRWTLGALSPSWASVNTTVANSASSISRTTATYYAVGTATGGTIVQSVDVTGYRARAMSAWLEFYVRNLTDTNDTITVLLEGQDINNNVVSSATATYTPATGTWTRQQLLIATLANVVTMRTTVTFTEVAGGGGTAAPDTAIAELKLRLGTFKDPSLTLANADFATGTTASWTNATNSFVVAATIASVATNYAQGGAFATSAIQQEYTLPAGWEVGSDAVLNMWRAQRIAGDTGTVTLEARDGGGAVLATTTTGAEDLATLDMWVERRLALAVPEGTAKIRVTLTAVRTGGAGNSGACFADARLSVHKDLSDARSMTTFLLNAPSVQPLLTTWQEHHVALPDLWAQLGTHPTVFNGTLEVSQQGISSRRPLLRWSDDDLHPVDEMVAQWGAGNATTTAFGFTRQSGVGALDVQIYGEGSRYQLANVTSAEKLTVIVLFRVDEAAFSVQCGLVGRMDGVGGWALDLDASGQVKALLQGSSGTKTATRAGSVVDGAVHLAAFTYDGAAQELIAYDERGSSAITSTAAGLGEIGGGSGRFRIGRSRDTISTIPGVIARVLVFSGYALTSAQIEQHWSLGVDPTGVLGFVRTVPCVVPGAVDAAGNQTVTVLASDQVAFGYDANLTGFDDDYVGQSHGLAVGAAPGTNLIQSFDFTSGWWLVDGGAAITVGARDATGKKLAATGTVTAAAGIKVIGLTMTAATTLTVVFWARGTGSPVINVELQNSSNVVKQTKTCQPGPGWTKCTVVFTAWDASTATARVRWLSSAGTITIGLTSFMFATQGEDPGFYPALAGGTNPDAIVATYTTTQLKQLNVEGELIAEGVAMVPAPASSHPIVCVDDTANTKNQRELAVGNTQQPRFDHYDSTPASNSSLATALDWSLPWALRGRWAYTKTLDNAANAYAGLVVDVGSVLSSNYGRGATWTYDTTQLNRVRLGAGTVAGGGLGCYLRRVILRTREEKLA